MRLANKLIRVADLKNGMANNLYLLMPGVIKPHTRLADIPDLIRNIWAPNNVDYLALIDRTITSFTFPEGATVVREHAFADCGLLTNVQLPQSLKIIGDGAFQNAFALATINLPNGITSIGSAAFEWCEALQLPQSLPPAITKINDRVFAHCSSLNWSALPSQVTEIGEDSLSYTGITFSELPNTLTSIGSSAFVGCEGITFSAIPASVQYLGGFLFFLAPQITSLTFHGTPQVIDAIAFAESNITEIRVPWSPGAVPGEPWSASNATIIYNYTP